jgi:hypothetical protein
MKREYRSYTPRVFAFILALILISSLAGAILTPSRLIAAVTLLPPEELTPTTVLEEPQLSPQGTEIITLPLVERNSGSDSITPVVDSAVLQATPVPETPEQTPTPTVLPPQTGMTNLPIVIGGAVIVLVILVAWLLVGWRPKSSMDF